MKKADAAKDKELQNLKEIHAKELQDVKEQADKHTKELLDVKDKAAEVTQSCSNYDLGGPAVKR
ncbi:MAG: hypothetical protein WAL97_00430 [Halobacteriota archaeon]